MVQVMVNRIGHYKLSSPIVHNQSRAEVLPSGGIALSVPQRAWAYAATFSLDREPSAEDPTLDNFLDVRIAVGNVQGEVGVGILSRDGSEVLAHRELTTADAHGVIELLVGPIAASGELVIRNASPVGAAGLIEMQAAEAFAVDPSNDGLHYELRSPMVYNQSRVVALPSGGVSVSVPESAWAYAATFPLFWDRSAAKQKPTDLLCVRIIVGLLQGKIGICVLSREGDKVLAQRKLSEGDATGTLEFVAGRIEACGDLVIRNVGRAGAGGRIELQAVETFVSWSDRAATERLAGRLRKSANSRRIAVLLVVVQIAQPIPHRR